MIHINPIYKVNSKAWDLLITSLIDIPFGFASEWNENAHEAWKSFIYTYRVSEEKQESLNEVTEIWNNFRIKDKRQDPDLLFNELYNLNLKFKKIKEKYEKYEYGMKARVFYVWTEEYNPVRVSCNVNIPKMEYEYLKKEISWF